MREMHSRTRNRVLSNSGNNSRCIMYQSRMKILKSRDGTSTSTSNKITSSTSGRRAKLGEKILSENSFSSSFVDRGTRKPCPTEKLLPPMQLMTKERSFRHLYLKYHPPKITVRMDFLQKKEDPKFRKKKEDIFARIRASEMMASERLKREKERVAVNEHKRSVVMNNDGMSLSTSLSEHSSNDESQQESNNNSPSINNNSVNKVLETESSEVQKDTLSFAENSSIVISGFVMNPSQRNHDSVSRVHTSVNNSVDDCHEEEAYGDCFAFLADWKREKNVNRGLSMNNLSN